VDISVAGINFRISCRDLRLSSELQRQSYKPFISLDVPSPNEEIITIDVKAGGFPDTARFTKIFDSNESWSMFTNGAEYLWVDIPPSSGGPICLAMFDRGLGKVTVYCGTALIFDIEGEKMLLNPVSYPLDQLLLMYALAERRGALIHASGIDMNGEGYIFPGKSGAGKSTISRILVSKGRDILSDDRIAARQISGQFRMFGTPWAGEAEIAENRSLPLRGIFFIRQSGENVIKAVTPTEAAERLMPVISVPWYDRGVMTEILSFCEHLVFAVPAYELCFRPEVGVADLFEEFVLRR